jgi:hypothetical protein
MSIESPPSCVAQIGATAGVVWQLLADHGSMSVTKLVKEVDCSRDLIMQALGWLAREDKIWIEEEGRKRLVGLR